MLLVVQGYELAQTLHMDDVTDRLRNSILAEYQKAGDVGKLVGFLEQLQTHVVATYLSSYYKGKPFQQASSFTTYIKGTCL